MPDKHPNTERWGGPGASHEDRTKPQPEDHSQRDSERPTNGPKSQISGGGGERDINHTHDPKTKN